MAYSDRLASRVRTVLSRCRGKTGERQMFGGICFTMNGHMVCGVVKDDLMVRVGSDAYQKSLRRRHVRPMAYIITNSDHTPPYLLNLVLITASEAEVSHK